MRVRLFSLATALLLSAPSALEAQHKERDDAQLRNDCRLAAQILRTGQPAPHRSWAYTVITRCDESGAATLASVWTQNPPADEAMLGELAGATRYFPMREVFDALRATAADVQVATAPRVYALSVVASFAEPRTFLNLRDVFEPRAGRPPRMVNVSGHQDWTDVGELAGIVPEVRTLLNSLLTDSDPVVARAATWYLRIVD